MIRLSKDQNSRIQDSSIGIIGNLNEFVNIIERTVRRPERQENLVLLGYVNRLLKFLVVDIPFARTKAMSTLKMLAVPGADYMPEFLAAMTPEAVNNIVRLLIIGDLEEKEYALQVLSCITDDSDEKCELIV